nr:RNA-directed DNA polymerase, eukaryota, reverse transcriptase zinc-binding domain protein [Tanacetum cinerariifolium]
MIFDDVVSRSFYWCRYRWSKVDGCMSRIQSWNETIERMACRLSKWKLKTLSIGDKGGLGVSSLFTLNRALMFKWVWRFITQGSSLWAKVIKALHGYDGKIGQKVKSCYLSLWLDVIHEVEMFKSRGLDVSFRRPPRGGVEIKQFKHMKEKVEGCILADMMDRWFWALKGSGLSCYILTSLREKSTTSAISESKMWQKKEEAEGDDDDEDGIKGSFFA